MARPQPLPQTVDFSDWEETGVDLGLAVGPQGRTMITFASKGKSVALLMTADEADALAAYLKAMAGKLRTGR